MPVMQMGLEERVTFCSAQPEQLYMAVLMVYTQASSTL